jgi:CsoR family transcriptional regulator, copper-sensing transcriptional repressor
MGPPAGKRSALPAAAAGLAGALAERANPNAGRVPVNERKSMKINDSDAKEKLIQRLRRIEGQLRGVQSMVSEERDCQEILQQLSAIRSAVQSTSRTFLQEYASVCLLEMDIDQPASSDGDQRVRREKIIQDMIHLMDKTP